MAALTEASARSNSNPILSLAERDRRYRRARQMMDREGLEGLVVFGLRGRERYEGYLSNESIEGAVILPREGEPTYISWTHHRITRRFAANMAEIDFWIEDVRVGPTGQMVGRVLIEKGLESARVGVVGLESKGPGEMQGIVPYHTWKAVLEAAPKSEFVEVTVPFTHLMLVKSAEELELFRHAAAIGERACAAMLDTVRPGARERDVYAAIMEEIHRGGAVTVPPNLILSIGADDVGWAPPYWNYAGGESRNIAAGDLVQAEIFPSYGGAETQMQMSVAVEPVPEVLHTLHDVARQCYNAGLKHARAGTTFQKLAEIMAQPVRDAGYWTLTPMVHSVSPIGLVGHIGINIEKAPKILGYEGIATIPPLNDMMLEPGVPLAFEPNVCQGLHRVNIGGTVIVSEDGPIELNTLATQMRIVG